MKISSLFQIVLSFALCLVCQPQEVFAQATNRAPVTFQKPYRPTWFFGGTGTVQRAGPQNVTFPGKFIRDETPPKVASTIPAAGVNGVSRSTNVVVTFSEPVDFNSVTAASLALSPSAPVLKVSKYLGSNSAAYFSVSDLAEFTSYNVKIKGVKDIWGNVMADFSWTFTTMPEDFEGGHYSLAWSDPKAVVSMAVDPQGWLYTVERWDGGNSGLKKTSGDLKHSFFIGPDCHTEEKDPTHAVETCVMQIAFSPAGELYALGMESEKVKGQVGANVVWNVTNSDFIVQKLGKDGSVKETWRDFSHEGSDWFLDALGIAVNGNSVYAFCRKDKEGLFSVCEMSGGALIRTFGSFNIPTSYSPFTPAIRHISVDPATNEIFILETKGLHAGKGTSDLGMIWRISPDRSQIQPVFLKPTSLIGEWLPRPRALDAGGKVLLVYDDTDHKIKKFSREGAFLAEVPAALDSGDQLLSELRLSPAGDLYAAFVLIAFGDEGFWGVKKFSFLP